jgi:hypothetical protein
MDSDFRIDEDRLWHICNRKVADLNAAARSAGQPERVSALDLESLYYAQGGRCAITGIPLEDFPNDLKHPYNIRLDHIQNQFRRSTVAAAFGGSEPRPDAGPIASIDNLQWVCHFANGLKEFVRRYEQDFQHVIGLIHEQCADSFPIRSKAVAAGSRASKHTLRKQRLTELFAENGHELSAAQAWREFSATQLEACYQTVLRELKEIGWSGEKHKRAICDKVLFGLLAEAKGDVVRTKKEWLAMFNERLAENGLNPVSVAWLSHLENCAGQHLPTPRRKVVRRASVGEQISLLEYLKNAQDGEWCVAIETTTVRACFSGWDEIIFQDAVGQLHERGKIDVWRDENGVEWACYAYTRKEAAIKIGVSPNRLKKWGGPLQCGPQFMKGDTHKSATYYSARTLRPFVETRTKTKMDAVGWQGTSCDVRCVTFAGAERVLPAGIT